MPVALRRITPAVVQSIQVFFQVVLYAGLFIFAQYLVSWLHLPGNDSNLLIVFYVQIMPDDFVMQLHRF